jgi:hypothetical protein
MSKHSAPPAPVPAVPTSAPAGASGTASTAAIARLYPHNAIDPATGRVIDPATGRPFQRGRPDINAPAPAYAGAAEAAGAVGEALQPVERVTTPYIVHPALRILAVFANPVQQTVAEGAKGYRKGGVAGIIPGIEEGAGRIGQSITSPEIARSDIGTNIGIKDPWLRAGVDFAGNLGVDWATGKFIQAPVVGGLIKGGKSALQASGAADIPLPAIGKSLNTLAAEGKNVRAVHQYFGAAQGKAAEIQREGEGFLQRANQRVQELKQAGINIEGQGSLGQRVNAVDEAVTHWIEAGESGAKYATRQDVLNDVRKLAQTPEQAAAIQKYVVQTGTDYSNAWQKVGQKLEQVKYLKPGTVQAMGGKYAARMYHATSHNPGDVEAFLDAASQIGGVNPKAQAAAESLLANERGGFSNASKSRTLDTYQQRLEHGGEFQASPLFAKSIRQQSNIAARGEALSNIAADPELVASTYARGKLQLSGRQYGNAEGLYVQPRTKKAIDWLLDPKSQGSTPLSSMLRVWRNSVVAGSLPMIEHHSKYVFALAEGRAAQEGVSFTPVDFVNALKERKAYLAGQGASPAVDALSKNTRAFAEPAGGLMQELGESLRSGIGIKSGAKQSLLRGSEKLANQTRKAIGTVEQAVKIALTRKLMTKYSPEEAAQIAQETISGTGPPGQVLSYAERSGVLPFITSRVRSAPKMLGIAAQRPDILLRPLRVGPAMATALGPEAGSRQALGGEPETTMPVPGLRDRYGRQVIMPNPLVMSPTGGAPEAVGIGGLGPLSRINDAIRNVRPTKQGGEAIVEPGSMPPWEALLKRLQYAAPAFGLGGPIPNAVARLGMASRGETQQGGPFREPETIGQAMLGIAFGGFSQVPETQQETQQRVTGNVVRSAPDMRFAMDYLGKLERGEIPVTRSPWVDRVRTPGEAAKQMKNSYRRLTDLVTGHEGGFAGQDRQQRIKNQIDWFVTMEHRFFELAGHQPTLRDLEAASQ